METKSLQEYISVQLGEQVNILKQYAFGYDYKPIPRRFVWNKINGYVEDFLRTHTESRWVILPGLRGVGKTTILAQIFFEYYLQLGKRILYVSVDHIVHKFNATIFELLDAYEEILGTTFSTLESDVMLLLDEVHYDQKWQFALKSLYDQSRKVFMLITGSSAIPLTMNADVARRAFIEKVYPLTFREYIALTEADEKRYATLSSIGDSIKKSVFEETNIEKVFESLESYADHVLAFWQGKDPYTILTFLKYYSLPATLAISDEIKIFEVQNTIIERIVEKDIPNLKIFRTKILARIHAVLFFVAGNDVTSFHSIARNLNDMEIKTLISLFDVLEKSELLVRIFPYGPLTKKIRKPSKYLFLASSLRASLLSILNAKLLNTVYKGKFLEDAVGMCLLRDFKKSGLTLSYDSYEDSADFIFEHNGRRIALEVGWKKDSAYQLKNTFKRISCDLGLLITDKPLHFDRENNIITLPLSYFFLM